ncbi:unnamed protein product [Allacma fusca]|uniref:Uncharacterized protein n=1 Tax=Allacma fusca TaxID=39272 RepID=A0A8J2LYY0_9HEXA|nr:unnamed protein product [Allacma fusca]
MPHIITVIAYPRDCGIWKMRLSGLTDHQYCLLRNVNPMLKRKSYGTFLTAKWRSQGAGHGRYIPMPFITPMLNILEDWGYSLHSAKQSIVHTRATGYVVRALLEKYFVDVLKLSKLFWAYVENLQKSECMRSLTLRKIR